MSVQALRRPIGPADLDAGLAAGLPLPAAQGDAPAGLAPLRPAPRLVEAPAAAAPPLNERSLGEEIHPAVYGVAFGAALWIVAVYGAVFLGAPEAMMMLAISLGFLVMYAGTPIVMWRTGRAPAAARTGRRFADFARARLETWTGVVHGSEAAVQIVTIPVGLAVAATGIALAIVGAR
ncbi:hypothetical protein SAMN06265365_13211 [Tistlia consotensis]|uniref:Uncharacterized protein n=1 Tax=Tistlia consotensis USBA 355 TaxID=560819 RepID=A0A1Y6CMD4_9PROT|nr:hypothetical protein [Tistlia consotensis]SMF76063.1 hypothetical protein SAMN05428998_13511 [Tistlia consotensis USBA 355]SNS12102.1 hypothetical protein SAMN06265365_13211 [Tistlia consotensis]